MGKVVEEGGGGAGFLTLRRKCCCCCCDGGPGESLELCEACLQVVKQCPPKKRFMRAGYVKPRPVIVKPASSIALDCLVEVALSPTDCQFPHRPGNRLSGLDSLAGHSSSNSGHGECDQKPTMGAAEKKATSSSAKVRGDSMLPLESVQGGSRTAKVGRYSGLPLEAVQKLKRLSSLDELPLPLPRRSAKPVHHGDHAKRFTPRFKSLLDISC